MKDPVTEAVGLPDISPHEFGRIRTAVLTDNLVYNRVLARLVDAAAPGVIATMHPLEKKRLRERLGFTEPETAPKWALLEFLETGRPYVHVECPRCKQSQNFPAPYPRIDRTFSPDGTERSEKNVPVTKERVRDVLGRLEWTHCGRTERPPQDLMLAIEQSFYALVQK